MRELGELFKRAAELEGTLPGGGVDALCAAFIVVVLLAEGTYLLVINSLERVVPLVYFFVDRLFEFLNHLIHREYERSDAFAGRVSYARPPKGAFWVLPGFLVLSVITVGVIHTT